MNLQNIASHRQASAILKAWWDRPGKIAELKEIFPEQLERIKKLHKIALLRKLDALKIEVHLRMHPENTETFSLTLN